MFCTIISKGTPEFAMLLHSFCNNVWPTYPRRAHASTPRELYDNVGRLTWLISPPLGICITMIIEFYYKEESSKYVCLHLVGRPTWLISPPSGVCIR